MAARGARPFLDRPVARVLALVVFVACLAALAWLERERFFPEESAPLAADDPFSQCYAERVADIDQMVAEGVVAEEQAALFRQRAEAMCRAQTGDGGPGLPAIPMQ